jgi:hypothetical protein
MKPGGDQSDDPEAQYNVGISTVSDSYITDALEQFAESHEQYILQWTEQHVVLDDVQTDHHGKRFVRRHFARLRCACPPRPRPNARSRACCSASLHPDPCPALASTLPFPLLPLCHLILTTLSFHLQMRMTCDGVELLGWRYTVMNKIGQNPIAVNVESCSYADATLVEIHRVWREVAKREGHPPLKVNGYPQGLIKVDNPGKDGPGICEAVLAGGDMEIFKFPGIACAHTHPHVRTYLFT